MRDTLTGLIGLAGAAVLVAIAFCILISPHDPPSPAPLPTIEPAPASDGDWPRSEKVAIDRALHALNERRRSKGLRPLALDAGLCRAAKALAIPLGNGKASPHDGFPERVRREGWAERDCGIRNRGFGNVSEGNAEGVRTPEEAVLILDSSPNPREGHRSDFEDPAFTHVGLAFAPATGGDFAIMGGYVSVVEYGAKCD